uniref:Uncharacterized protein n=1 Tax=Oryza barthii TaxID=65489 RepID=A0A0D3GHW6_9ORYZ
MVARRRKAFSDETAVSSSSPFSWCKACIVMQAHGGSEWNGVQMDGCRERPRRCVQTPKATSEAKQSMQQQQGQGVAAAAAAAHSAHAQHTRARAKHTCQSITTLQHMCFSFFRCVFTVKLEIWLKLERCDGKVGSLAEFSLKLFLQTSNFSITLKLFYTHKLPNFLSHRFVLISTKLSILA